MRHLRGSSLLSKSTQPQENCLPAMAGTFLNLICHWRPCGLSGQDWERQAEAAVVEEEVESSSITSATRSGNHRRYLGLFPHLAKRLAVATAAM